MQSRACAKLSSTIVYAAKNFPGMSESTFLSRSFGDQGVRLRIRKEPRTLLKRPPPTGLRPEDYSRQYAPPMPPDPRGAPNQSPMNQGPPMGQYLTSPASEYPPYTDASKRQRMTAEMGMAHGYDRDSAYDSRMYQAAPQSYNPYAPQPPAQPLYPMYGQTQPQGPGAMSAHSYRHPTSSMPTSPYDSPNPRGPLRSPQIPPPGYGSSGMPSRYGPSQQAQQPQQQQQQHIQASSGYGPNVQERPPPQYGHAGQGAMQTPGAVGSRGSNVSPMSAEQSQFPTYRPMHMPPPPPSTHRSQAPQVLLPPLQSTLAPTNPSSPAVAAQVSQHSSMSLQTSGASSSAGAPRYQPGPPASFDSAAQQTTQAS